MSVLKWVGGTVGIAALAGLALGVVVGVPVLDNVDRYFSSNDFCAKACHVMADTVAAEFETSTHGTSRFGVIPKCSDCHVSENLTGAMIDHALGVKDLYANVILGINTAEKFETIRTEAANTARMKFYNSDSANCRSCHVMAEIKPEKKRGQVQHVEAIDKGITCIVCHYDLVHKSVPLSAEFDAIVGSY
ncbi:MAG: NapC/NirT family cytochrome c [Pseudorhodobacter sp.]|nr:NapC/NirT family cytochrome c [Pseudorhodobacter sp.]